ncbi:unnamed protein product [Trichobilharzia regenti]|nr:unnamed protein product [Trichobilharzia regenti]
MRRSFMEAAGLRRELERRQWLTALRKKLDQTTTFIPSAGSSNVSTQLIRNSSKTLTSTINSRISVPFGEPILQVKCPLGQTGCCDEMTTYYQDSLSDHEIVYCNKDLLVGLSSSNASNPLFEGCITHRLLSDTTLQ